MSEVNPVLPAITVTIVDRNPVPADHYPGNPKGRNPEIYTVDVDFGAKRIIDINHGVMGIIIPVMRNVDRLVVIVRGFDIYRGAIESTAVVIPAGHEVAAVDMLKEIIGFIIIIGS